MVFQTRWALSYLRGPLTREQIQTLMAARKQSQAGRATAFPIGRRRRRRAPLAGSSRLRRRRQCTPGGAAGRAGFLRPARGQCSSRRVAPVSPLCSWAWPGCTTPTRRPAWTTGRRWPCSSRVDDEMPAEVWAESVPFDDGVPELDKAPRPGPVLLLCLRAGAGQVLRRVDQVAEELPLSRADDDRWTLSESRSCRGRWSRSGSSGCGWLRRRARSAIGRSRSYGQVRARTGDPRGQIRRARERLERDRPRPAGPMTWDATVAMGSSVLGALLGRKALSKTNVTKAASAAKAAGRAAQQRGNVGQAEGSLDVSQGKYAELEARFQEEVEELVGRCGLSHSSSNACASTQKNRHHRGAGGPGLDALPGSG